MSFPSNPKIAIVGAGAIGCYYGGRLAQLGQDVHFLMRSDYEHVKEHGLTVKSVDGDFLLSQTQVYQSPEEIGPCDLIIISLKTTSNQALLSIIPPLLHSSTAILTLQNGLGNEDLLAQSFGAERVLGGLCFVCINRLAPGLIDHQAQGLITLGEYKDAPSSRAFNIQKMLQDSKIPCQVADSLMQARWKKLVWNIPFNGLSIAAGSLTTQQILAHPQLKDLTKELMLEVIGAANHLELDLPLSLADAMIQNTEKMGAYKTSSLLDYDAGKEVEVESIWGEPLRKAKAAGYSTPRLEMLYQLLSYQTLVKK